jgi:hypothetical protein
MAFDAETPKIAIGFDATAAWTPDAETVTLEF